MERSSKPLLGDFPTIGGDRIDGSAHWWSTCSIIYVDNTIEIQIVLCYSWYIKKGKDEAL